MCWSGSDWNELCFRAGGRALGDQLAQAQEEWRWVGQVARGHARCSACCWLTLCCMASGSPSTCALSLKPLSFVLWPENIHNSHKKIMQQESRYFSLNIYQRVWFLELWGYCKVTFTTKCNTIIQHNQSEACRLLLLCVRCGKQLTNYFNYLFICYNHQLMIIDYRWLCLYTFFLWWQINLLICLYMNIYKHNVLCCIQVCGRERKTLFVSSYVYMS